MRTLKNYWWLQRAMFAVAMCTSCAVQRSTRIVEHPLSKTEPEEVILPDSSELAITHHLDGQVLTVRLIKRQECRQEWNATMQRVEIQRKESAYCSSRDYRKLSNITAWIGVIGFVGTIVLAESLDAASDRKASSDDRTAVLLLATSYGGLALSLAVGIRRYCDSYPKETRTDLGPVVNREHGGEYQCRHIPIAQMALGLKLASGVILEAVTDEDGYASYDLSGADQEDIQRITIYVPEHNISFPVQLASHEKEMLTYALTPKRTKLGPLYNALKTEVRHGIRQCYEDLFGAKKVGGKVVVAVEVAPSGQVRKLSADFDPGTLAEMNHCLWNKVAPLRFGGFEGEALALNVPMTFAAPPSPKPAQSTKGASSSDSSKQVKPVDPKKNMETVLVGGSPVAFVHDPTLGCTAGVAACQVAVMAAGGCKLIKREVSRAIGGLWGLVAGVAAGAVCDSQVQEICTKALCK